MPDASARIDAILERHGLPLADANAQDALWQTLVREVLHDPRAAPFDVQWRAWQRVFANRPASAPPPAAYGPDAARVARANVTALAQEVGVGDYAALHAWSARERDAFWQRALDALDVPFRVKPRAIREGDAEDPVWLPGARLNASELCFRAKREKAAIVLGREGSDGLTRVTYGELDALADRVAHGLRAMGLREGDAIALYLPMTVECVAAYLGAVRAGCPVVSIADSFAPREVATRMRLGEAKAILTTSGFARAGKTIDLYAKALEAKAPAAIVIASDAEAAPKLRGEDVLWQDFLGPDDAFEPVAADPYAVTNVLFSSGTTGDPKAIPWTHLTPLKAAMDARYHQDVHEDDVVAWPTSIGWMMGPWLVYASLANRATMALYEGAPNGPAFAKFVQDAGVTMLGLVPALARAWRTSGALDAADWTRVRTFSSTGEASNVEDYLWLMSRAGYRAPVIEYCGGTEIGGGHLTGTVVQPQSPATFSTPALGLDFVVLSHEGKPVAEGEMGELFIIPPSIGLSQRLLNRDHHEVYYADAPSGPNGETLRRHGDEVMRLAGGYYVAHGRADDTMNLGGIKVSSLELERAMDAHPDVYQTAAVSWIPPTGGADQLVVFVVPARADTDAATLKRALQDVIKRDLNPLYRIHDVVLVETLPRTASNKIMRRELRAAYHADG